jgi:hypothetical protein
VLQRLADRLKSEFISRRMKAAGYRMIAPLGEGTYGAVWLAEEESTGIKVAVKFFAHGAGRRWQMLQDEVRRLAALDAARGIVHLKDAIADADPPYYVMSYAERGSLAQRLEKGPLPVAEALAIFREVVEALAYVHAHGIRHCDLKPANILLDRLGKPLVADFGQAHLSDDASPALGTFFYMAPEQADLGEQIPDTRWDVYGAGALFYAMLTGQPPRKDAGLIGELKGTLELDHRLRRYREGIARTPRPTGHRRVPGVDRDLASIIDECLELEPNRRPSSADAVLRALDRRRVRRRQRPLLAAGIVAPLVILLAMSALGWFVASGQIEESEKMLVGRVLEDDTAAARLAAGGLEKGFKRRTTVIGDFLKPDGEDPPRLIAGAAEAWREAAADPAKEQQWRESQARLNSWLKGVAEKQKVDERFGISTLTVVDRDGFMLTSVNKKDGWAPANDFVNSRSTNWSWRDWFSGQGNRTAGVSYPPVTAPHISQPYKSVSGGAEKVDVTVPVVIPGAADGPVGVLVGSMAWEDLSAWLRQLVLANGRVAVFNDRGQFLMHGNDDVLASLRDYPDNPPAYDLSSLLVAGRDALDSYHDPLDPGRTYLAGYKTFDPFGDAPVGDDEPGAAGRWGVVVQHDKAKALEPVERLQGRLRGVGAWTLAGAAVVIGGLWWGLIWLLRRQERLAHG